MGAIGAGGARLVLASHNRGKLLELRQVVGAALPDLAEGDIVSAAELGAPDVVEDGVTFEQNALLKARALAAATGVAAVADDSGIAVDVLGGAPGIFSARWCGRHGDDAANLQLLLAQLSDVPDEHRGAQFVCAAALVTPSGEEHVTTGVMRGALLREPRGSGGFGYDPIFLPDGETRSAAELPPEAKNAISHRGKAFRQLAPLIAKVLTEPSIL